jgi:hypothetical protein
MGGTKGLRDYFLLSIYQTLCCHAIFWQFLQSGATDIKMLSLVYIRSNIPRVI